MSELVDFKIALVEGYAIEELMKLDYPELEYVLVKDTEQGLRTIQNEQADVFIGSLIGTSYVMRENGYSGIIVAGDTPYTTEIHLATDKDSEELRNILDKSLDALDQEALNLVFGKWRSVKIQRVF